MKALKKLGQDQYRKKIREIFILGQGTFGHVFCSVAGPRRVQSSPPKDAGGLFGSRMREVKPFVPQVIVHGDH